MNNLNISQDVYDTIIIGGGPAGYTAGIYAARARMKVLLIESFSVMGQATMTDVVENYPGFESVGGFEIVSKFKKQATAFGLDAMAGTVSEIAEKTLDKVKIFEVTSDAGSFKALSLIIATGASPKKLDIPGEKEFIGKGVSYCATCDGAFFRDKDVVVVGGGDTAVEEAMFLTKFARKVTIIHRRDRFRAAKILQERAFGNKKIEVVWNSTVKEIAGKEKIEKIVLENVKTKNLSEFAVSGVFVFVGWKPNTEFVKGVVELDKHNCIPVDNFCKTSKDGVYAAGDCCQKVLHQIVTACGDGAVAAYSAGQYVDELKGIAYK